MKRTLSFAALAVTLSLVACNGGGGYGNPPGYGMNCIPPTNTVLVYPKNNATGVPDNTTTVYIAVPSVLPAPSTQFDTNLVGPPSYGSQLTGGFTAVSYGSIPTPNTVPGYSNPQYYASTLTYSLVAATSFDVYWNNLNSACNSTTSASLLGSFTTT